MTLTNLDKAPFPYFGGKRHAAAHVWAALGDVPHYVEPFAGSLAVLICRPHLPNRPYVSETVNDTDGLLCNAWRSIQQHPDETADAASWPVSEADLRARHLALVRWARAQPLEQLMADPAWCDPQIGGWWLWGISCWIGGGWCAGTGPWTEQDGRFIRQDRGTREPGVSRQLPVISNDGGGVNRPGTREPGVLDDSVEPHPMTMPELRRWFRYLAARLRHVRILHGDWTRAVTTGATLTIPVRQGHGPCGIFLDPPYADTADRTDGLYAHDDLDVAHTVREWCVEHGDDPRYRIVLAGFDGEHSTTLTDHGWREIQWYAAGFLRGGMGNVGVDGHQQGRERLWLSPHTLTPTADPDQLAWEFP